MNKPYSQPMTRRSLIIRADANHKIGIGHLMRCLALAQAWRKFGGQVVFFSHCDSPELLKPITAQGFGVEKIPAPHPHPSDLDGLTAFLDRQLQSEKALNPWVVVDGYHFDAAYQKAIREKTRLMVIDDYNHLPEYRADIILNQNPGTETLQYHCPQQTRVLAGTRFVMFRQEFLAEKQVERTFPKQARNILVSMGGADTHNVTQTVLAALKQIRQPALTIRIILGPACRNAGPILKSARTCAHDVRILCPADDMPGLIRWADTAVTAGGTTCWEMSYLGLPMIIVTTAENQVGSANGLSAQKACMFTGSHRDLTAEQITGTIIALVNDSRKRRQLSRNARALVDGRGVERIFIRMNAEQLHLKPVGKEDMELLWKWVNDPFVRQSAFNPEKISRERHADWFDRMMASDDTVQFILYGIFPDPVGQIRFDFRNDTATIDYSVAPNVRGLGLGREMVNKGIGIIRKRYSRITTIEAKVKPDNAGSNTIFSKLGFTRSQHPKFFLWRYTV